MKAFAAVFDDTRPPGGREDALLSKALEGADGSLRTGPLALAWRGDSAPSRSPVCFVDGSLFCAEQGGLRDVLAERGPDAMADLRGDFALLFYDEPTKSGWVGIDHCGCRSVVWHTTGSRLLLASDVRFLLPLLSTRPAPDESSLAHWLTISAAQPNRTMFQGVHNLTAGSVMRLDPSNPAPRRYWSPEYSRPAARSASDEVEGLRSALHNAVRIRSAPDAAVLLSGGLDSSSVAALAATLDEDVRPRTAYSAVFPGRPTVDEGALIDRTCAALGLASTRAVVEAGSVIQGAAEYIATWDDPPTSPNLFFWIPLLNRVSSDGHVVLLDGEGGDEVFGLSPYLIADRLARLRVRSAGDLVRHFPGGSPELRWSRMWPYLFSYGVKGLAPAPVHRAVRRVRRTNDPGWLSAELRKALFDTDHEADWKGLPGPRWWRHLAQYAGSPSWTAALTNMRRRAAMTGVESRHPLMDVDVLDYVMSLPPEGSYDTRFNRPRLRSAVEGLLPDEVRLRPTKSNFDAMFHDSLAETDLEMTRGLLTAKDARLAAYVDMRAAVEGLFSPPAPGQRMLWALRLWRLVTAECWLRGKAEMETLRAITPGTKVRIDPPVAKAQPPRDKQFRAAD